MLTALDNLPHAGRLEFIGVRPQRRGAVVSLKQVAALEQLGLEGDHRALRQPASPSPRQVTLIQAEHLGVVAALLKRASVDPAFTRRNLAVSGINLLALVDRRFQIGEVVLEGTGRCHPCSRMEETLGVGGYSAMRGHGGITARVLVGGRLTVGDAVTALD